MTQPNEPDLQKTDHITQESIMRSELEEAIKCAEASLSFREGADKSLEIVLQSARKYDTLLPLLPEFIEEVNQLRGYLRLIAQSEKSTEMDEEFLKEACWKTGFDSLIEQARESLFARDKAANLTTRIKEVLEENDESKFNLRR